MILNGDCLEVLKTLPENSIDSLVTDPPAGISFMGKEWDSDKGGRDGWISWMAEVMKECHRVLKPGAHGLVWAIPRTSHWTATALENAGFEIRDVVTHLFGSGFPKSLDISKAIDKAAGAAREVIGKKETYRKPQISPNGNVCLKRAEFETAPTTDSAKQWQGWGTALKPASEHWILIRKPCSEKTVAANVLKHGCGGINIDASRISSESMPKGCTNQNIKSGAYASDNSERERDSIYTPSTQGRFPANLVLSHSEYCTENQCDIECAIKMLDEQSGPCKTGALTGQPRVENKTFGKAGKTIGTPRFYTPDAANGASRFFYCAKISTSERNAGLEDMPDIEMVGTYAQDEWSRNNMGSTPDASRKSVKNNHPTVKPKKLMSYFIKMITPPGGTVLDPFMGSGSTGIAAKECGFMFVGIEKQQDYFEIAKKRVEAACEAR